MKRPCESGEVSVVILAFLFLATWMTGYAVQRDVRESMDRSRCEIEAAQRIPPQIPLRDLAKRQRHCWARYGIYLAIPEPQTSIWVPIPKTDWIFGELAAPCNVKAGGFVKAVTDDETLPAVLYIASGTMIPEECERGQRLFMSRSTLQKWQDKEMMDRRAETEHSHINRFGW